MVAEKLGRRWIGCDIGRHAIHATRKRLLHLPAGQPFEVLDLGEDERRYWLVAKFGEEGDDEVRLHDYVALILKLYGASPASGMRCMQGRKGRAFVHVGGVDSTITTAEISACLEECADLGGRELHVLGWEWAAGCQARSQQEAAAHGILLVLRQIPREVMEERAAGEAGIEFFELAHLDVELMETGRKGEVVVRLKNYVVPNPELVPDDVRGQDP